MKSFRFEIWNTDLTVQTALRGLVDVDIRNRVTKVRYYVDRHGNPIRYAVRVALFDELDVHVSGVFSTNDSANRYAKDVLNLTYFDYDIVKTFMED